MVKPPEPDFIAIGRILRPHGVRGELRVAQLTDYPERWRELETVYLGANYTCLEVESSRIHKEIILLKLIGLDDRDAVENLRGELLYIPFEQAILLKPDEFYHFQVIGFTVRTDKGEILGEIAEVLRPPGANEIFVIHGPRGEILVPVIKDVILNLDIDAGEVLVHLLPGLLRDT
jgi:16S rRNA processing protein RimM